MNFKRLAFILLLISIFSCENIDLNPNAGKAILNFDKQIINIGEIKSGVPFTGKFVIRNKGGVKLIIDEISTDCACTVADISKKDILPGDSIYINYSVNPHLIGFFQQEIIIKNNSDSNPVMFVIRGKTAL